MTDELKPGTEPAAIGDDETTRTPVTPPAPAPAPAPAVPPMTPPWDPVSADPTGTTAWTPVAPTAPVTPAGRTSGADPVYENDVAWSVSAPGRRGERQLRPSPRRSDPLGGRPRDRGPDPRHHGGRCRDHHRPIGRLDGHRLRAREHHDVRGGPARPARRPAPGRSARSSRSSRASRTRPRSTPSSTRSSTTWSATRPISQQTYTGDIKPWFDGELAYSMGPLPPAAALKDPAKAIGDFRALALVSVKDPAGAQAWLDAPADQGGRDLDHGGLPGRHRSTCSRSRGRSSRRTRSSTARSSPLGDVASVKAAIDTNGSGGFANEPGPKAALGSVSGDHVGFAYMALRPLLDWTNELSQVDGRRPAGPAPTALDRRPAQGSSRSGPPTGSVPDDAIVMEATVPKPETAASARPRTARPRSPSTSRRPRVVAATTNDLGKHAQAGPRPVPLGAVVQVDDRPARPGASASSAGRTRPSAGWATAPRRRPSSTARPKAA